jgi:hypothetical protein
MNIPREILPSTPVSTVGFIILLVLFAAMFRRVGTRVYGLNFFF